MLRLARAGMGTVSTMSPAPSCRFGGCALSTLSSLKRIPKLPVYLLDRWLGFRRYAPPIPYKIATGHVARARA